MQLKSIPVLIIFFLTIVSNVFSQNCGENISGTKTLYALQQKKPTPPPAGFTPVFINYVGRHGARHLTKSVDSYFAWKILMLADSLHQLTVKGDSLKQMVMKLQKVEQPNLKSISTTGKTEQEQLGARMTANYKPVFTQPGVIKVITTKEIRTGQSAGAFLAGAEISNQNRKIQFENNNTDELRFYDVSPAYLAFKNDGDWQKQILLLAQQNHVAEFDQMLMLHFFKPEFLKKLKYSEVKKLTDDIFGFASIVPSIQTEIKTTGFTAADLNIYTLFTCAELDKLNLMDTAEDYLLKGPGTNANGIQAIIAAPLLVDFLNSTQNYIDKRSMTANLRFGHAETIGPFATLLGLDGAATASESILNFQQVYHADKVIPLSANISWILYDKNSTGNYLIKFLLNEKEVHVKGLKADKFPYYRWEDVRAFYLQKLKLLHIGLADEMHQYLLGLK